MTRFVTGLLVMLTFLAASTEHRVFTVIFLAGWLVVASRRSVAR